MKRFFKLLLGLGILVFGVAVAMLLWITRPEADKKTGDDSDPDVKVMRVEKKTHTFVIPSQGIVEADKRSTISAEVAGRIIEVAENFETGMVVGENILSEEDTPEGTDPLEKVEPLVTIDPTNYESALAQAKSALEDARSALASERARAAQAESDWRKMGRSGEIPDLVKRGPQLRSAEAREKAAEAAVHQAEADLSRTRIKPPYKAIIAATMTEEGNYVTPGTPIAEIYATAPYEIRLPLSIDEARFLQSSDDGSPSGKVTVSATAAGTRRTWDAEIIRSEGEIDRETRSLFVVVKVEDDSTSPGVELRPGLFVKASITGQSRANIAAIPFQAFRDLDTVVVVDPDNQIQFRDVTVIRREGDAVYVSEGLSDLDQVCLTEMPDLIKDMKVSPTVVPSPLEEAEDTDTQPAAKTEP